MSALHYALREEKLAMAAENYLLVATILKNLGFLTEADVENIYRTPELPNPLTK